MKATFVMVFFLLFISEYSFCKYVQNESTREIYILTFYLMVYSVNVVVSGK